jgi:hypothetical protein
MDFKERGFEWRPSGSGRGMLEGYCESPNTFTNSIKGKEILDQLNARRFQSTVNCVEINQCLYLTDMHMNATICTNLPLKATGFKHLAHRTIAVVDLFLVPKLNSHSVQVIIYFSGFLLYFGCYSDC